MICEKTRLVVVGAICTTTVSFAEIGENFTPAGIELYGDLYLSLDAGWIFSESNDLQELEIGLRPGIATFFAQNLSFYISPQFFFYRDLTTSTNFWELIIYFGVTYYFVSNPWATTGLVPSVDLGIMFEYEQDEDRFIGLAPRVRLLYFVTDRIAPSVSLVAYFSNPNYYGSVFSIENTRVWIEMFVGMSFFFPSKDRVLRGNSRGRRL